MLDSDYVHAFSLAILFFLDLNNLKLGSISYNNFIFLRVSPNIHEKVATRSFPHNFE